MNSSASSNKPWLASYPPDVNGHLEPVIDSLFRIFERPAQAHPDKPCMDFLDKKLSYGEAHDLICRFAFGLRQAGIGKGDRIGLCMPNCPYYPIAFFAAQKIGAIVVNFNVLYTAAEIEATIFRKVSICVNAAALTGLEVNGGKPEILTRVTGI